MEDLKISAFSDFSLASTIFCAVLRFFTVFCLANCLMTTEASRLTDFTNANFGASTIFRAVLRFFAVFCCLANCLMTTEANRLAVFTEFAKTILYALL